MANITPRKLTFNEYDKYMDLMEELKDKVDNKEMTMRKMGFQLAKWVLGEIYGIDLATVEYSNELWDLFNKTIEMTEERELNDEKNSVTSGNGE